MADEDHAADSVLARASDWLKKTGYPLEMRVTREFMRAMPTINEDKTYLSQGDLWRNYSTNVRHEADVVLDATLETNTGASLVVGFCIECKAPSKPWIVLRSALPQFVGSHIGRTIFSTEALHVRGKISSDDRSRINSFLNAQKLAFTHKVPAGLSIVEAHTDSKGGHNPAYKAVTQAIETAEAALSTLAGADHRDQNLFGVVVPLIVTSGPLLIAELTRDGREPNLREVSCARVNVYSETPTRPAGIYVVQEEVVGNVARDIASFYDTFDSIRENGGHVDLRNRTDHPTKPN